MIVISNLFIDYFVIVRYFLLDDCKQINKDSYVKFILSLF